MTSAEGMTDFDRKSLRGVPLAERFEVQVYHEPNTGCWLWGGPVFNGHPSIWRDGQPVPTRRVSYELHRGPIPSWCSVAQTCRTGGCVNPDHLRLVDSKRLPPLVRFWSKVRLGTGRDDCWTWTGSKKRGGYGQFCPGDGTSTMAHQFSHETFNGPIPDGLWVLHGCNNASCVNPYHLRAGTPKENAEDRDRAGHTRAVPPPPARGEEHPRARLTWSDVAEIRRRRATGEVLRTISADFGITMSMVSQIARGTAWS